MQRAKGGQMNESKVSSKDVAREAGVSQATVSYVLNNVKGVKIKPETKEAVLNAAKKLNYHPNLIARSMRLKKAMSIGIVSDKDISNYNFMKVLEGIKDALVPRNYSMTLCFDRGQDVESAEHIKYYSSNRVDGIIFAFANVPDEHCAYLVENNIPFVLIHTNVKNEMINLVKTDMSEAVLAAFGHLLEKGIERVAFFGGGVGNDFDRRYTSYKKAMEYYGLSIDEGLLLKTPAGEEDIERFFDEYFDNAAVKPRAVICETTNIAFRLLKYAVERGMKIPSELAVAAIGTSKFSPVSYPALSAVESPLYDMGYTGCEMLFDIMNGNTTNNVVVLEWTFTPRETT